MSLFLRILLIFVLVGLSKTDDPAIWSGVRMAVNQPELRQQFEASAQKAGPRAQAAMARLQRAVQQDDLCNICQATVGILKPLAETIPFSEIRDQVVDVCRALMTDIYNVDAFCPGLIDLQGPHVFNVLRDPRSNEINVCHNLNACFAPKSDQQPEDIGFWAPPALLLPRSYGNVPIQTSPWGKSGEINIMQIADIHIDPKYAVGSPTDCRLPTCCREDQDGQGTAGLYGDFKCNTPQRTVNAFLKQAKDLKPDFIIYTGDNPSHHMWRETRESQLECSRIVYQSMRTHLQGFRVFSAMGNHESYPTNLYNPEEKGGQMLTAELAKLWAPLAGFNVSEEQAAARAAFYTVLARPGLRVLTVNTNLWYVFNWYNTLTEKTAVFRDMQTFIQNTLAQARRLGEKVIMVYHHPIGRYDQMHTASRWLQNVLNSFADVIVLQVAGHTHKDSFKIVSDVKQPRSVVYIDPAVTALRARIPSLRVYTLDAANFTVKDYTQHHFDIFTTQPTLKRAYQAREEYDLPDLTAASWFAFTDRLITDPQMREKWLKNFSPGVETPCDQDCQVERICDLRHSSWEDVRQCMNTLRHKMVMRAYPQTYSGAVGTAPVAWFSVSLTLSLLAWIGRRYQ